MCLAQGQHDGFKFPTRPLAPAFDILILSHSTPRVICNTCTHKKSLFFSHLGFWSRNLFLIAPFPDLCLLVPFHSMWAPSLHKNLTTLAGEPRIKSIHYYTGYK